MKRALLIFLDVLLLCFVAFTASVLGAVFEVARVGFGLGRSWADRVGDWSER